jgi:hypothetical protein
MTERDALFGGDVQDAKARDSEVALKILMANVSHLRA